MSTYDAVWLVVSITGICVGFAAISFNENDTLTSFDKKLLSWAIIGICFSVMALAWCCQISARG